MLCLIKIIQLDGFSEKTAKQFVDNISNFIDFKNNNELEIVEEDLKNKDNRRTNIFR